MTGELHEPDLEPIVNWISINSIDASPPHRHSDRFAEAVVELQRLLEEFRFEVGVGAMYAYGVRGELTDLHKKHTTGMAATGMPRTVMALLAPDIQKTPPPLALLREPTLIMSGNRVLGGWWAAQQLDSALIRGMASLDRLAVLLYCAADKDIGDKAPAFRLGWLREVKMWEHQGEWEALLNLVESEFFKWVTDFVRNGFVHRSRAPLELHGDHTTIRPAELDASTEVFEGITADTHLAIPRALYGNIILEACRLTGALIAPSTPEPTSPPEVR